MVVATTRYFHSPQTVFDHVERYAIRMIRACDGAHRSEPGLHRTIGDPPIIHNGVAEESLILLRKVER